MEFPKKDSRDLDAYKAVNNTLLDLLACPVCLELCSQPIFMCTNGHNVCHDCQLTVKCCPTCKVKGKPKIRNLFAEETSITLRRPCINEDAGCLQMLNFHEMQRHLEECNKRYYTCISPSTTEHCEWKGTRKEMEGHLRTCHPNRYSLGDSARLRVSFEDCDTCANKYLQVYGELFLIRAGHVVEDEVTHVWAEYIGDDNVKAAKFECEFTCRSEDGRLKNLWVSQTLARSEACSNRCEVPQLAVQIKDSVLMSFESICDDVEFAVKILKKL